jgi:PleD family two-component response regulator
VRQTGHRPVDAEASPSRERRENRRNGAQVRGAILESFPRRKERAMVNQTDPRTFLPRARESQKVVIVNGSPDVLEMLESVMDPGHYEIMFVESGAHAYSQIKRVRPQLVILCMRIEDLEGFQVLSMLKLDDETFRIPVLTYTTEYEGQDTDGRLTDSFDSPLLPVRALPMN